MNNTVRLGNLNMLQFVATKLGELCDEVVFLGGCTTALFINDKASPDVRSTLDVDCIVDVISLNHYHKFEKRLVNRGFKKSMHDDVICRWRFDDVILDVMPTDEKILGFGNCWSKSAIKYSTIHSFSELLNIKVITAPYFLATKLEAFKTRGKMDFLVSHDFEDIIAVIDGRLELINDIEHADSELRQYLADSFNMFYQNPSFHDALPGHFVHYGNLADDRIEILLEKIQNIISNTKEN